MYLEQLSRNAHPLRGILAEEVGMNGEVKRPQRGGNFAGAQGPHRVPPAKAVKKELSVLAAGYSLRYREN